MKQREIKMNKMVSITLCTNGSNPAKLVLYGFYSMAENKGKEDHYIDGFEMFSTSEGWNQSADQLIQALTHKGVTTNQIAFFDC